METEVVGTVGEAAVDEEALRTAGAHHSTAEGIMTVATAAPPEDEEIMEGGRRTTEAHRDCHIRTTLQEIMVGEGVTTHISRVGPTAEIRCLHTTDTGGLRHTTVTAAAADRPERLMARMVEKVMAAALMVVEEVLRIVVVLEEGVEAAIAAGAAEGMGGMGEVEMGMAVQDTVGMEEMEETTPVVAADMAATDKVLKAILQVDVVVVVEISQVQVLLTEVGAEGTDATE